MPATGRLPVSRSKTRPTARWATAFSSLLELYRWWWLRRELHKVGAIQLGISGVNATDGQIGPIQTAGPTVFAENLANMPLVRPRGD